MMKTQPPIPFNRPAILGKELEYIKDAVCRGKICGDGYYTRWCQNFIEDRFGTGKCLLTTSATSALEMAAILAGIEPGDEVIMPSFTFVSTANAFLRQGAKPVFVDIRPDTLNLDENKIEPVITARTKAIVPVHYAGVGCEMDPIMQLASSHRIMVIEDAAQAIDSRYREKFLGTIGEFGAFSFHETKNVICGEGGCLLINREKFFERAEILWEKGTNRRNFFRGLVDKYTWVDVGSSFLPSEIIAAYLKAQLENLKKIQLNRKKSWDQYHQELSELAKSGIIKLPSPPPHAPGNHHIFQILVGSAKERDRILKDLKEAGILAVFHYVPLHDSPVGHSLGYLPGDFPISEDISGRLIRLPLYYGLTSDDIKRITNTLKKSIQQKP